MYEEIYYEFWLVKPENVNKKKYSKRRKKIRRLGDLAIGTETILRVCEVVLPIRRLRRSLRGAHSGSAPHLSIPFVSINKERYCLLYHLFYSITWHLNNSFYLLSFESTTKYRTQDWRLPGIKRYKLNSKNRQKTLFFTS